MRKSDSGLIIPIQLLSEEKKVFSFQEKVETFPVFAQMESKGEGVFVFPVEIAITLYRVNDIYRGEGNAKTRVELQCGRCLEKFVLPLEADFTLTFSRFGGESEDGSEAGERDNADEDASLIRFCGEELDLGVAVQEQLLMALPVRPLCRQECLGLCPTCGADRNREACNCSETAVNPKWGALAGFKVGNKGK